MGTAAEGERSGLSSVTRGTLLLLVAAIVSLGAAFVVRIILVRGLSSAEWNVYSDSIAIVTGVSAIGGLGLEATMARNLPFAHSDSERRSLVRVGLLFGLLSSAAISVSLYLVGPFIGSALGSSSLGYATQVLGLGFGISSVTTVLASVFQGFEVVLPYAVFVQMIAPLCYMLELLIFYPLSNPQTFLDIAVWSNVAAATIALAFALVYTLRNLPKHLPRGPALPGQTTKWLAFSMPLFGLAVFSLLDGQMDTVVLGAFQLSQVGPYTVALILARLLQIGILALAFILLPVMARLLSRRQRGEAELTYSTATKWMALFSVPLFLVFFFLPGPTLDLVFGSRYTSVTLPLMIVTAGGFGSALVGPAVNAQIALGRVRLLFLNSSISLAADIGVALWLVPQYGMLGAAAAWALATVLLPALAVGEIAILDGIHPFQRNYLVPLLLTTVPCAALLSLLQGVAVPIWVLPPLVIGLAFLYVGMILATRSIDRGDLLLLEIVERLLGRRLALARRWLAWGSRGDL